MQKFLTGALVAVVVGLGCVDADVGLLDAGGTDAGTSDGGISDGRADSGVGLACTEEASLCGGGFGRCHEGTCRAWCGVVTYPRCGEGTAEKHLVGELGDVCLCVPAL